LSVRVPGGAAKGTIVAVAIALATTEKCTALQWMAPSQTSNKKFPYMFSQCQAIHNRSIFPCQDTPDVKSTYDFKIRSPLPVVASGLATGATLFEHGKVGDLGTLQYSFKQEIPMPSYLFALASGDIATASIGPRSLVSTGPEELSEAKWELEADTEKFIQVAEKLIYPYKWTQYNVLVLPPSFPYGGMENPVFTFATPTIISGDRENVDVIAHELSHSWSGNLVSNASWEHFWLNEGWTTYLERRIGAAVHGEPHRDFSAIIGWKALQDSVAQYGDDHEFTKLVIDLKGKDPDDAFSSIPYEKGFHFLYYLEKLVGKSTWDKFIPHYFTTWMKKSLDSYDFKATLLDFFASDKDASKALEAVDWDSWFYKPGLPPKPYFDTSIVDKCYALADKWESNVCQLISTSAIHRN
jgi:leukotriene-A4 hydrolase